jgi:hypothetical protein
VSDWTEDQYANETMHVMSVLKRHVDKIATLRFKLKKASDLATQGYLTLADQDWYRARLMEISDITRETTTPRAER